MKFRKNLGASCRKVKIFCFNLEWVISFVFYLNIGGYDSCELGPFQLIPYSYNTPAAQFTDEQSSNKAITSCSLRKSMVKFPDNTTELQQRWLDKSYIDLMVFNNTLQFKVRKNKMFFQLCCE